MVAGLRSIATVRRIMSLGFEKVVLNAISYDNPEVVREAVQIYGSQAVVASIDVKRKWLGGYHLFTHSAKVRRKVSLQEQKY